MQFKGQIMPIVTTLGILLYIIASMSILYALYKKIKPSRKLVFSVAIIAIFAHMLSLYIITQHGLIGIADIISATILLVILSCTIIMFRTNTLWVLLLIVYLLGAITLLHSFYPAQHINNLSQNLALTIHIIISLSAYALSVITSFYAIQLSWLNYKLRSKTMNFSPNIPPLIKVEREFSELLKFSIIMLTLTLITGVVFLDNFFNSAQIHKAVFSFITWIIFIFLYIGKTKLYWRGKKIVVYTLLGMIILTFAYFASFAAWR